MRISEAAQRLGTSPRMLRYREILGLLPPVREPAARWRPSRTGPARGPAHRQFTSDDLAAVALALDIEKRLDISPAALAFGLKVLSDARVRAEVAELGRRIGRIPAPPGRALDFEKERALRLLNMSQRTRAPEPRPEPAMPAGPAHPSGPTSHASQPSTSPGRPAPHSHARG
jgi:MerR family transcriptional regulator, copper efflux regulator